MKQIIDSLKNARVMVIGDIMLDVYYEGDASRISPEAPVPVVNIEKTRYLLGGAANVAKNISTLGAKCSLIGIVGSDENAIKIDTILKSTTINKHLIETKNKCTTVKSRVFARNQQIIRFDEEEIKPINSQEKRELLTAIEMEIESGMAIILSDYGKGVIYKELVEDIYSLAKNKNLERPKIIIDPKPINKYFYTNAYLMTPNTKEASELSKINGKNKTEIIEMGKKIQKDLKTENILITLGAEGMALFSKNNIFHIKSTAKQVFDVTGAGDTVIAILAIAISNKLELDKACLLATIGAGIAVEKVGSVSTTQEEILDAYYNTIIESEKW